MAKRKQSGKSKTGRLRIVAGNWRSRVLEIADVPGLRPTSERIRETLFNWLAPRIRGARCLDLFAGTGALGFEALSRGAARAVFVGDLGAARALIRENIEKLRLIGETRIYRRDATKLGPCRGASFDLIFLDPPYGAGLGERALASAQDGGWIAPEALIVWEEAADAAPDCSGFALLDERRYGATTIRVLRVD